MLYNTLTAGSFMLEETLWSTVPSNEYNRLVLYYNAHRNYTFQ